MNSKLKIALFFATLIVACVLAISNTNAQVPITGQGLWGEKSYEKYEAEQARIERFNLEGRRKAAGFHGLADARAREDARIEFFNSEGREKVVKLHRLQDLQKQEAERRLRFGIDKSKEAESFPAKRPEITIKKT